MVNASPDDITVCAPHAVAAQALSLQPGWKCVAYASHHVGSTRNDQTHSINLA